MPCEPSSATAAATLSWSGGACERCRSRSVRTRWCCSARLITWKNVLNAGTSCNRRTVGCCSAHASRARSELPVERSSMAAWRMRSTSSNSSGRPCSRSTSPTSSPSSRTSSRSRSIGCARVVTAVKYGSSPPAVSSGGSAQLLDAAFRPAEANADLRMHVNGRADGCPVPEELGIVGDQTGAAVAGWDAERVARLPVVLVQGHAVGREVLRPADILDLVICPLGVQPEQCRGLHRLVLDAPLDAENPRRGFPAGPTRRRARDTEHRLAVVGDHHLLSQ